MTEEIKNSSDSIKKDSAEQNADFGWLGDQSLADHHSYRAFEKQLLVSQDNKPTQRDKETVTWIQGQLALIGQVVEKRDLA